MNRYHYIYKFAQANNNDNPSIWEMIKGAPKTVGIASKLLNGPEGSNKDEGFFKSMYHGAQNLHNLTRKVEPYTGTINNMRGMAGKAIDLYKKYPYLINMMLAGGSAYALSSKRNSGRNMLLASMAALGGTSAYRNRSNINAFWQNKVKPYVQNYGGQIANPTPNPYRLRG